jgi:hypothetical protein
MIDLKALAAPFPPDRISWRIGSTNGDKTRGMALAYLDSRDVQDRLDEVCGVGGWQSRYPHATGKTVCEIGIKVGDEWIWKADGAGDTDVEAEKGALSDAFKRAAVRWGIGRYLYDVESPWVEIEPAGRSYKIKAGEYAKLRAVLGKGAPPVVVPASAPVDRTAAPKAVAQPTKTGWQADAERIKAAIKAARDVKTLTDIIAVQRTVLKVIEQNSTKAYDHLMECYAIQRDAIESGALLAAG